MKIATQIKALRQGAGLTQKELSKKCGVSWAFIQRVEYGNANPSVKSLSKILNALNADFLIKERPINWSMLYAIGIPIGEARKPAVEISTANVKNHFLKAYRYATENKEPRLTLALESWLLALKAQFPTQFRKLIPPNIGRQLSPHEISGQHIKLKRIAESRLAEIL